MGALAAGGPSATPGAAQEKRRRSTKACDNCRKAKSKCQQPADAAGRPVPGPCQTCQTNGQLCTYEASSRKRGPPKGYIEAVEQRLHRMEALLGGLIENEDPRAQALLGELIGDEDAQTIFRNDLKTAAAIGADGKGKRSGQSPLHNTLAEYGSPHRHWSDGKRPSLNPAHDYSPSTISGSRPREWYTTEIGGPATLGLSPSNSNSGSESDGAYDPRSLSHPGAGGHSQHSASPPKKPKGLAQLASTTAHESGAALFTDLPANNGLRLSSTPSTIPHTGFAHAKPGEEPEQLSELADVVGQLSLNEGGEIRYHGRSSGLYLVSESQRYKDFFWRFPGAGVWPPTATATAARTDEALSNASSVLTALPDQQTQDRLLEAYWTWVHPVLPILYRSTFSRQYAATPIRGPTPASGVPASSVPRFLLLAIFALASHYLDVDHRPISSDPAWTAGDDYSSQALAILGREDLGLSRLTTVQGLLLLAYREVGMGAMARGWACVISLAHVSTAGQAYAGLWAWDLGLFRDVDRWYMPAAAQLSYEEKQTRKRVWWGCVFLDRYVSAFIGRPMAVHERDWDTAFPSEGDTDEFDTWTPDGPAGISSAPSLKSHCISTFNRASSLAVHLGRVIIQLYAIRVRVIGQSSTALLSHLDQQIARWYLSLPSHLQYAPSQLQPPSVLVLHANFYTTLILLHRPFTPNRALGAAQQAVPSHSIATTAANAIANLLTAYHEAYGLRRAVPMLIYYAFSAAIMHVYNLTYDPALANSARDHLGKCMRALREMSATWGAAWRQLEVLLGLAAASKGEEPLSSSEDVTTRQLKRPHESLPSTGRNSPMNAFVANGEQQAGFEDFTFNVDDLFSPADAAFTSEATKASMPNPIFADLLDSFFAHDGGTSGFNELNTDAQPYATSPSVHGQPSSHVTMTVPDMSGPGTNPSRDADWTAYLAGIASAAPVQTDSKMARHVNPAFLEMYSR